MTQTVFRKTHPSQLRKMDEHSRNRSQSPSGKLKFLKNNWMSFPELVNKSEQLHRIFRIMVPSTVTLFLAGINVMVTDEMVASIKSESSYKINISSSTNQSADGVIITIQQTGV